MLATGGKPRCSWAATMVLVLALAAVSVLGVVPATRSQTVTSISTSNGATVCPNSLSGNWSGTNDTCSIKGPLVIASGTALDIGTGVALTIPAGVGDGIDNNGVIDNNGTISSEGGSVGNGGYGYGVYSDGVIDNDGTLFAHGGGGTKGIWNTATGTINNAGAMTGESDNNSGVSNGGTINNAGTLKGYSVHDIGISNTGTIDNTGTMTANSSAGPGSGFSNLQGGTVNNAGNMTGTSGGEGFFNFGTIDNEGAMTGIGTGGGSYGMVNVATINDDGALNGTGASHGVVNCGGEGFTCTINGAFVVGTINDYCGATPTGTFIGVAPNAISCYTDTFVQAGLPSGAAWGVTASWGPFALPRDHAGSGASVTLSLNGTIAYSYDSPAAAQGKTYYCSSGCSGVESTAANASFTGVYSPEATTTVTVTSVSTSTVTSTATPPPPTSGSITVYVYSAGGKPLADAKVTLTGASNQTITTSGGGEALFSGVPLASYTVAATVDGAHLSAPLTLYSTLSQAMVVLEPSPSPGLTLLDWGAIGIGTAALVGIGAFLLLRLRPGRV